MDKAKEWVGKDRNGIPRVWGTGPSHDVAESQALAMARDYLKRRPDTGPLDLWSFAPKD